MRPAYANRQTLQISGVTTELFAEREFVQRKSAVGAIVAMLEVPIINNNGAGVARTLQEHTILENLRASLNLKNGQAPVCTGLQCDVLQMQAALDHWLDSRMLASYYEDIVVADGDTHVALIPVYIPLANLRSPASVPHGEIFGEHISDYSFQSSNLLAGLDADFGLGAAGWRMAISAFEYPCEPFLGAARTFRAANIADSVQGISYGLVEDVILCGNVATFGGHNISIRRGDVNVVELSTVLQQCIASSAPIDPSHRLPLDNAFPALAPVIRGYGQRLTTVPFGRLEISNHSANWPAGTRLYYSATQPMAPAVREFVRQWTGLRPASVTIEGTEDPAEITRKVGPLVNYIPLRMLKQ